MGAKVVKSELDNLKVPIVHGCKGVVVLCQEQHIWRALVEHSDGKIRRGLGRDIGTRHKQNKNIAG